MIIKRKGNAKYRFCRSSKKSKPQKKTISLIELFQAIKEYVKGDASTNSIEGVWSILKRAYYGIYHHYTEKHAKRYADEVAFRLSKGSVDRHIWTQINSLLGNAFKRHITYKELVDS